MADDRKELGAIIGEFFGFAPGKRVVFGKNGGVEFDPESIADRILAAGFSRGGEEK